MFYLHVGGVSQRCLHLVQHPLTPPAHSWKLLPKAEKNDKYLWRIIIKALKQWCCPKHLFAIFVDWIPIFKKKSDFSLIWNPYYGSIRFKFDCILFRKGFHLLFTCRVWKCVLLKAEINSFLSFCVMKRIHVLLNSVFWF